MLSCPWERGVCCGLREADRVTDSLPLGAEGLQSGVSEVLGISGGRQ